VSAWSSVILGGVLILILAVVPGLYFFWPSRRELASRSDLGIALMTGALVAFSVLVLQVLIDQRLSEQDEKRSREAHFQQLVAGDRDLTGIQPPLNDLSGYYLRGRTLDEANLRGKDLTDADLTEARLVAAHLEGAKLVRTKLVDATLNDAFMSGSRLTGADLSFARLHGAGLQEAKLVGTNLEYAELQNALLQGATVAVTMADTNFSNAHLEGADLSGADGSAVFEGAYWDAKTGWPPGYQPKEPCESEEPCRIPTKSPPGG
jgi:uncharacterized protein YjbI with pentapeptide repeats